MVKKLFGDSDDYTITFTDGTYLILKNVFFEMDNSNTIVFYRSARTVTFVANSNAWVGIQRVGEEDDE